MSVTTEPRLRFLRPEKLRGAVALPCRLPGCKKSVPRRTERAGRAKWFHDEACSREFARRRAALDAVINDWFDRLDDPNLTTRERDRAQWELRWVVGVRASYVGPTDWLKSVPEGPELTTALARLFAAWRARSAVSRRKDPCRVCNGTGDFGEFRRSDSLNSPNKSLARRAQARDAAYEAFVALRRLEDFPDLDVGLGLSGSDGLQLEHLVRTIREALQPFSAELDHRLDS